MRAFKISAALVTTLLTAIGCNGIFGGIYDEVDAATGSTYGFIEQDHDRRGGTIFVDAQSYEHWFYLDFHNHILDSSNIIHGDSEPPQWDIALHRYDVKTNGGEAAETQYNDVDDVYLPNTETLDYEADIYDSVVVDMSTMMQGYLGRCASPVNRVLSRWLNVNTSEMPPIYTLSHKVYIVRFADRTRAALLFSNYMNEASQKGYITIKYRYPL